MSEMTAREMLSAAADYMEKHGKCEGRLDTIDGQVCVIGALVLGVGACGRELKIAFDLLTRVIDTTPVGAYGQKSSCVASFSDTHDQTEVVEAMRKAADLPDW